MTAKSPTSSLTSFLFETGTQGWYLPLHAYSVQEDRENQGNIKNTVNNDCVITNCPMSVASNKGKE